MPDTLLGPMAFARVFVDDLQKARLFYGMMLGLPQVTATDDIAIFDTQASRLLIERVDADEDPEAAELLGRFTGLSFVVADAEEAYKALQKKGVSFDGPPEPQDWGGRLVHFSDPSGNILTLVELPED
ncbi:MAG: VOC family protein [Alphaproteobacteria bacterium]|nr:VOC family protein [Alphaproteobacteria bacterium]